MSDEQLSHIPISVEELQFRECAGITGHLRRLGKLINLRELSLMSTPIESQEIMHVAKLPNLEKLNLNYTQVDDRIVEWLDESKSLKTLHVRVTKLSPEGVKQLESRGIDVWD